jgi:hypothetical protein
LLGVLIAGEFDCETSDEFVCANATALSSNAAMLNDEIVFINLSALGNLHVTSIAD